MGTRTVLYNWNNQSFDGDEGLTDEQVLDRVRNALEDERLADDTILEYIEIKFALKEEVDE
jgi:hypothetical protein